MKSLSKEETDRNENPENYYIWRAKSDSKTRSSHADRDGKVFRWDHPPEGGHPGEEFNCRCKAEPYEPPKPSIVDKIEYASFGAMQGLSLGWSDEIEGAMSGLGYGIGSLNPEWNKNNESFTDAVKRGYIEYRDKRRNLIEEGYKKSPVVMGASEFFGGLANPSGKLFTTTKTAPLTIKARKNIIEAIVTGGIYGTGTTNINNDYGKNILFGIGTSFAGNHLSKNLYGRGNSQLFTKKFVGGLTNTNLNNLINLSSKEYFIKK